MAVFKKKPEMLTDVPFHYCPGCTHGIAHRLVAEVIDELNIKDHLVGIAPVGCAVFAYDYFNCDMQEAAHGRAPAVATGIKRSDPNNIVFAYQGDGDLASIGMAEIVHAAARSENRNIHQQRYIRNDGRTDGSDDYARTEGVDLSEGKDRRGERLSYTRQRDALAASGSRVYRKMRIDRRSAYQQGEGGDQTRFPESDRRQRLFARRAHLDLSFQLEDEPARVYRVCKERDDEDISSRRI